MALSRTHINSVAEIAHYNGHCKLQRCMPRRLSSVEKEIPDLDHTAVHRSRQSAKHSGIVRWEYEDNIISQKSTTALTALKKAKLQTGRNDIKAHVCSVFQRSHIHPNRVTLCLTIQPWLTFILSTLAS